MYFCIPLARTRGIRSAGKWSPYYFIVRWMQVGTGVYFETCNVRGYAYVFRRPPSWETSAQV